MKSNVLIAAAYHPNVKAANLRSLIQNGESADDVDAKIDSIKTELAKAEKLFS